MESNLKAAKPVLIVAAALLALACGEERPIENDRGEKATQSGSAPAVTQKKTEPPPVERDVLLLGLDGATWDVMDPLLKAGRLPNFAKVIGAGARAPLATYKPTLSPLIWTTISTGAGPRVHGITGFTAPIPGEGKDALVTSNMRKVKALWNIATDAGVSSGTAGWWATFPAEKVDGFMISDQASVLRKENYAAALDLGSDDAAKLDPRGTWPPTLAEELREPLTLSSSIDRDELRRFGDFPDDKLAGVTGAKSVDKEDIVSIFKFAYLIDKSFIAATLKALEKHPVRLTSLYLNGLDAAEHHFWKFTHPEGFEKGAPSKEDIARYAGLIDEYYVYMDEVLGEFLKRFPLDESVIIIVSDHGHQANADYDPGSTDHFDRVCSGTHDDAPDGVIIMAGKDIAPGAELHEPSVFDVTPTTLALLGLPLGEDMKGRPLIEGFTKELKAAHPVTTVKSHGENPHYSPAPVSSEMTDALTEKLRGLGYIK